MNSERFIDRPLKDRLQLSDKERAKFPECSPIVVAPKRELGANIAEKKYSIQPHVRVMDLVRILQDTHKIIHKNLTLALFAHHSGRRVLLRNDEFIC